MAILGCIADDFTGASDAASFIAKGGMSVQLYSGVPQKEEEDRLNFDSQAMVIALKSRTQDTKEALADSIKAAEFLLRHGVKQIYFKYCSTFDSTPAGNIGPVADALMELTHSPYTILCPALPVNGRVVKDGKLYVNGVLLHESHMKNHPLTPMWDCRIDKLMEPQSQYPCYNLGNSAPDGFFKNHSPETPFYLIPDYETTEDGARIAEEFADLPLLTGGSGLLEPLAAIWARKLSAKTPLPDSRTKGRALLLAGSCSKATLEQIACYQETGGPSIKINPAALLSGEQTVDEIWDFIKSNTTEFQTVLAYSSDTPEHVQAYQKLGTEKVAALLEGTAAELAVRAVKDGFTRIISAGGETSGAVTKGLGFSSYQISESVAPGVPVMLPLENPGIRLVLKSGNFGQKDFFSCALRMTSAEDPELDRKLEQAVWIAHSLFERQKTSGSSANISFRHGDRIYISASGTCFGTLAPSDFAVLSVDGTPLSGKKASKEWPLHLMLFQKSPDIGAVIHTHSTYSVLWSFVPAANESDCIPPHTPYLKMKLGTVGLIPYEKPGSKELFDAFRERIGDSDGYLLKQHGPVVPGKDLMDAFFSLEELEESAKIAWLLYCAEGKLS